MSEHQYICALTHKVGKHVKAHILPKALTKPDLVGASFLQSTQGKGYKKRFSSWYDQNLVIREGEDIFAKLDDQAIKLLRKDMLVWSSWHCFKPNFEGISPSAPNYTVREFKPTNPKALHKFFVSIAWRACASELPDMKEAHASEEQIEAMRQALVSPSDLSDSFFPVSLTQLTTTGIAHNLTPIHDIVKAPKVGFGSLPEDSWEIIRIYFDGLIAHVHLNAHKEFAFENPMFLGSTDKLIISGITYETSFQYENMLINAWECHAPFGSLSNVKS